MSRGRRTTRKAQQRRQLLDLATAAEAPFITIDGVDYDLVTREAAGVLTQYRAAQAAEDLGDSDIEAAVDAKDWAAAQAIMTRIGNAQSELVRIAVPTLPEDVLSRLSLQHKFAIISAFTATVSGKTPTGQPSTASRPTGENGRQGSSDSMEPEAPSSG